MITELTAFKITTVLLAFTTIFFYLYVMKLVRDYNHLLEKYKILKEKRK